MNASTDTIFALSSGSLPSGVAVIRLSGPQSGSAGLALCGKLPEPRLASMRTLRRPEDGEILDQGLVLWMPGPGSFTGEDCLELHVHGGRAVVESVLSTLGKLAGCRLARAGEFSLRAFENGRIDLTEAEGLADLIAAETEFQRRQAVTQAGGSLRRQLEAWRGELIRIRAMIEAGLDFSDEDDVSGLVELVDRDALEKLVGEIRTFLDEGKGGEIVREGFRVALIGKPNAGKSSLLNALARRDVAIVDESEGTTRDVLEVRLDLEGREIVVSDTAGFRETRSRVEAEGIRRALEEARKADVVIWLSDSGTAGGELPSELSVLADRCVVVRSKIDLQEPSSRGGEGAGVSGGRFGPGVSVKSAGGLDRFIHWLGEEAREAGGNPENVRVTRLRHKEGLENCIEELEFALQMSGDPVLCSEHIRLSGDALGRLTGRIDVEDLLDVIFSEFCIGK